MPVGTVLVVHPAADLYGSDLQLLESVSGLIGAGWRVVVAVPHTGPLLGRLTEAGADVRVVEAPVLRKSLLSPAGLVRLLLDSARAVPAMLRLLGEIRPDAVYVNTVTVPLWLLVARFTGRRTLGHVHEAEDDAPRMLSFLINAPLLLASAIVVNSRAARQTLLRAVPILARRTEVIHNGMPGPGAEPAPARTTSGPRRLVLVGRLSPRKGIDVAVEAVALLRAEGREVELELCGTVFPGYEWFEEELRARSSAPDLAGHVHLAGYVSPTWPALARADVVLVPSRAEPFGNTAVEAQLAGRPVVASAVQGLREIVTHEETGLLVPPDDPVELARAVARVLDDAELARRLADDGQESARRRFSPERYRREIAAVVARIADR